ncbi:MAG: ABC transporter ATP-binding protein/permease [Magnetococcus sp. MYC-9]
MMPPVSAETEETRDGSFLTASPYRLMGRFFRYARPYRGWVMLALLLLPISALLQLWQPLLIQQAVDHHLLPGKPEGFAELLLMFALLIVGQFGTAYLQTTLNTLLGQRLVRDMRRELFAHLLCMEAAFFSRNASGRLTNRISNDTEAVSQMVSAGMINLLGDLLLLVGIGISMVLLSPELSLITLIAMPVIVVGTLFITRKMRDTQRRGRLLQARMAGHLTEEVEGRETVRLFHCQEKSRATFDRMNRAYLGTALESNFFEALQFSFIDTTSTVVMALLFWYGGYIRSESEVSIGVIVAFIDYIRRIFFPIREISSKFTTMQSAITALERIFALLDTPTAIADGASPRALPQPVRGEIEFQQVQFGYGSGQVLHDITLHIRPGERVAVVGPTGAGKSSLIKLLNRTYEPQQGLIKLDGVPIQQLALAPLRRAVGMVQQETFLFAGTIADNISLGDPQITPEQVQQAAEETGAMEFIRPLPQGLATPLMERGSNLSAGQRQLLGITRVLAFRPRILVMDEATSSVDTLSERLIQEAMERLLVQRTALIIAHRLSTILHADRIVVLSAGAIVEQGRHAELLEQGGLYARLYALQFQEKQAIA